VGTGLGNGRNERDRCLEETSRVSRLRKNVSQSRCRLSFNDVTINVRLHILSFRSELKQSFIIYCALFLMRVIHYYYYLLFQVSLQAIKRYTPAISTRVVSRNLAYFILLLIRLFALFIVSKNHIG